MLKISHYINLNQDERYRLHEGEQVEIIGHIVPVWEIDNETDEPAKEIFCKYLLKNEKYNAPVKIIKEGFEIMLPYREGESLEISQDEWRHLTMNDPEKLNAMYKKLKSEISSKNLLEYKDGGKKCLHYRERCSHIINGVKVDTMHFINFRSMERLLSSIT